jgi:hypothetical protein
MQITDLVMHKQKVIDLELFSRTMSLGNSSYRLLACRLYQEPTRTVRDDVHTQQCAFFPLEWLKDLWRTLRRPSYSVRM